MRLYKVVILVNLALGVGVLVGYHWRGQEAHRLRQELDAARQATRPSAGGEQTWSARGVIRAVVPERKLVIITHEEIPGVMSPMTMAFPATDGTLLRGLSPGDRVDGTLRAQGGDLVVVALRKATSP